MIVGWRLQTSSAKLLFIWSTFCKEYVQLVVFQLYTSHHICMKIMFFFCICMCISADSEHVYHCNNFVLRSLTLSPLNFYLVCLESPFSVYFTQESALFISSYNDLFYYYEVCWGQRTVGWFHNRILLFIFHSRETLKVIYC